MFSRRVVSVAKRNVVIYFYNHFITLSACFLPSGYYLYGFAIVVALLMLPLYQCFFNFNIFFLCRVFICLYKIFCIRQCISQQAVGFQQLQRCGFFGKVFVFLQTVQIPFRCLLPNAISTFRTHLVAVRLISKTHYRVVKIKELEQQQQHYC